MGRTRKGSGAVGAKELRISPPASMTDPKALELFDEVLASWPDDHFIGSDAPTIEGYCYAVLGMRASRDDSQEFARYLTQQLNSARALRITPYQRQKPDTAAARAARGREKQASVEAGFGDDGGGLEGLLQ